MPPLLDQFDSNRALIVNGGSFMNAFASLGQFISGSLTNKLGCRTVCIIGCIISAVGIGLSSYSPNAPTLILLFGFIGGLGIGAMNLSSLVIISKYFDRKRGLATGIVGSGTGVGMLAFTPLTGVLIEAYGWNGTLLALGFISVGSILFTGFMGTSFAIPKCHKTHILNIKSTPETTQDDASLDNKVLNNGIFRLWW